MADPISTPIPPAMPAVNTPGDLQALIAAAVPAHWTAADVRGVLAAIVASLPTDPPASGWAWAAWRPWLVRTGIGAALVLVGCVLRHYGLIVPALPAAGP